MSTPGRTGGAPGARSERRSGRQRAADLGPFHAAREITTVRPKGRWLSDYEVAICRAQSDLGRWDTGGWYVLRRDGSAIYDHAATAVRHPDWSDFRDPSGLWQKNYVALQAEEEGGIARHLRSAQANGSFADMSPRWCRDVLGPYYEAWACVESALFIALSRCVREALSDTVSMALVLAAVDRARHQQDIANLSLSLVAEIPTYLDGLGLPTWREDLAMAPMRWFVERLLSTPDWVEVVVVTALVFDAVVADFFLSRFLRRFAPLHGDVLTPTVLTSAERDRARFHDSAVELVRMLVAPSAADGSPVPCAENRRAVQGWIDEWAPAAVQAIDALTPVVQLAPARADEVGRIRVATLDHAADALIAAGLEVPDCLKG